MKHNKLFIGFILVAPVIVVASLLLLNPAETVDTENHVATPNVSSNNQNQDSLNQDTNTLVTGGDSPPPLPKKFITQRKLITQKLTHLQACPDAVDCPEKQYDDPRAAAYELGQRISKALNEYLEIHLAHDVFDNESRALTISYLAHPDGHVQEQAIKLLAAHPVSNEAGRALISALQDGYDAPIFTQAMRELERYKDLSSDIDELFLTSMSTGSFFVAREIAKNILPFLNANNIDDYRQLLTSLPPRSKRARYLKTNIKEYELRLTTNG